MKGGRQHAWRAVCCGAGLWMLAACRIPFVAYGTSVEPGFDHESLNAHLATMQHYVEGGMHESKDSCHAWFRRGRAYAQVWSQVESGRSSPAQRVSVFVWSDLSRQPLDVHLTWSCLQLQQDLIEQLQGDLPRFSGSTWTFSASLPDEPEYRWIQQEAARRSGPLPTVPTSTNRDPRQ